MKRKTLSLLLILMFAVIAVKGQTNQKNVNPAGTWKFEAPYAPEGYTTGNITIGVAEKVHTASISFSGSDYKIPGEKVKLDGDSLKFTVYLEGNDVNIILKLESATRMSGKAVYSEGEIPLTLTKAQQQVK